MLQFIRTSDTVTKLFDTIAGDYVGYILKKQHPKTNTVSFSVYGNPHFFLKSFGSEGAAVNYCITNLSSHTTDEFSEEYNDTDDSDDIKSIVNG